MESHARHEPDGQPTVTRQRRRRNARRRAWVPRWQSVARLGIVGGLALFATILVGAIRERAEPAAALAVDRADPEAIIESTGAELVQTSGGIENYRLNSGHQLIFSDGSTRFEGGFQLEVAAQDDRDSFVITGEDASVDDSETRVAVRGAVEMRVSDGLGASTDEATYVTDAGKVEMPGPTTLTREGLVATGRRVVFERDRGVVDLGEAASVQLTGQDAQATIDILSTTAQLDHDRGYMHFAGGTAIETGPHLLTADTTSAYFGEEDTALERLELTGTARMTSADPEPAGLREMRAGEMTLAFVPESRALDRAVLTGTSVVDLMGAEGGPGAQIGASTMDVTMDDAGADVRALVADGRVRLQLPNTGDGTAREIRAESLMTPIPPAAAIPETPPTSEPALAADAPTPSVETVDTATTAAAGTALTSVRFDRSVRYTERVDGQRSVREIQADRLEAGVEPGLSALLEARFRGNVRFVDGDRSADADLVVYDVVTGQLSLESGGDAGRVPRLVDGESNIEAPTISVMMDGSTIAATGGVQNLLASSSGQPTADSATRPALLEDDQQMLAKADSLTYDRETGLATYDGDARIWQGDTSFQGDTVSIDDKTGAIVVDGNAKTTIQLIRLDESTGEQLPSITRVKADKFTYDDALHYAIYDQAAELLSVHGDMKANTLEIFLRPDGRTLDRLEATGNVKLRLSDRWATGDHLVYYEEDGRYEMEGAPVEIVEEVEPDTPLTPQPPPRPGAPPPRPSCQSFKGRSVTFYRDNDSVIVDGRQELRTESGTGACRPQVF